MNINSIKKYIINLKRRPDRLEHSQKEMEYMDWNYEVFEGVDKKSYVGCGLSHMAVAQLLLDSNDEHIIVMEDDLFFMPYAKQLFNIIENTLNQTDWDLFHFAPSIHRPLNRYNDILVDLSNLPPRDESRHRGVFGTSGFIYNRKVAELLIKWNTNDIIENIHMHDAIDQYFDKVIYPRCKSFCAAYPLVTQIDNFSDINGTYDKNHYLMTYNWGAYINPLPGALLDHEYCINLRRDNQPGITL
jgi:GR25 family glycosyltransferase involved in LPS biosynthesis